MGFQNKFLSHNNNNHFPKADPREVYLNGELIAW